MEFKGTKEKWEFFKKVSKSRKTQILGFKIGEKEIVLSSVFHFEVPDEPSFTEEEIANALLISKAPEMLEMLDSIIQCSSSICNDSGEGMIIDFETFDEIQQLIKEATEL